jgi:hypothetical protein
MKMKESSKPHKLIKELDGFDYENRQLQKKIEAEKLQFINQIKKQKKEDLLPKAPEKLSLWKKLQKVLMGL